MVVSMLHHWLRRTMPRLGHNVTGPFTLEKPLAATATKRPVTNTHSESPVAVHEIDEALAWSSAIPARDRDKFWRLWCDRLLDQRLRIAQCEDPASTVRS